MGKSNLNMSPKKEEKLPKHVTLRVSYKEYQKLAEVAEVAAIIKDNKDLKKALGKILDETDITAEKFLALILGLSAKGDKSVEKFLATPPRKAPKTMYFTDPQPATESVTALYQATKKWTKGKLRFDQKKQTCPTDVRVMFYAYVREEALVAEGSKTIAVNKFLRKIAPKNLSGVRSIERKDSSFIWGICSEIRGVESKPKQSKKSKSISSSESESESESDIEPPKKVKSKRR